MSIVPKFNQFDDTARSIISFFHHKHRVGSLLKRYGATKKKGICVNTIFSFLFSVVFTGKSCYRTIRDAKSENSNKLSSGGMSKDTVYRFLKSASIDWLGFLTHLASRIAKSSIIPLTHEKRKNVFIIDDSIYERGRSKKVELISRVYDHAKRTYSRGYRMLTLGWSDGNTFLPVSFNLLSTKNPKNRLVQRNESKKGEVAERRRDLALQEAPDVALHLLRKALDVGMQATYVLFDSWYSFPAMLLKVKKMGLDSIAMVKRSSKIYYTFKGKRMSVKDIFKCNKKRPGRSRYLLSVNVLVGPENGQQISAKLVFVRNRNKRNDYLVLISTDVKLSEEEIIQIYGKRWSIECFFKVCKGYLRLATGCLSLDFDAITTHVAIVFSQFMMLSENQRIHSDDRSIGDLFFATVDELQDLLFEDAIFLLITAVFNAISEAFELSENEREKLLETFLSAVPIQLKSRLQYCA